MKLRVFSHLVNRKKIDVLMLMVTVTTVNSNRSNGMLLTHILLSISSSLLKRTEYLTRKQKREMDDMRREYIKE